jgi:hypothetical protein
LTHQMLPVVPFPISTLFVFVIIHEGVPLLFTDQANICYSNLTSQDMTLTRSHFAILVPR